MNKKYAALLIPLMLLPLVSFGYAHFTDHVTKKYKLHVGSVEADIVYFHVDNITMLDENQNGFVMDDELTIEIINDPATCTWFVKIKADPVTGGFLLNTTMKIHNSGHMPWRLNWEVFWNMTDDDECWNYHPENAGAPPVYPDSPWSWDMCVKREIAPGVFDPPGCLTPTQVKYEPCQNACITQHVNFIQPDPGIPQQVGWQKEWQCNWMMIWVKFQAIEPYEDFVSEECWTWP